MASNGFLKIGETTSAVFKKLATYIAVDPGDLSQIHIGRNTLNDSDGNEFNTANPFPTKVDGVAGTGITPETGATGSIGWLSSIYKRLTGTLSVSVTNFPTTQTISATSLPLPTGAATETTLSSMSAKLPATIGQKTMANSLPVVIASDQTLIPTNITQIAGTTIDTTGIADRNSQAFENVGRRFNAPINPTPLTAVTLTTATQNAYVNTAPNILITAGANPVVIKEILLRVAGAGTGLTAFYIMGIMDSTARYTSGGTTIVARNNALAASTATIRVGTTAIVSPVPSATARTVFQPVVLKSAITAINDMFHIVFGETGTFSQVGGTRSLPAIRIPANGSLALHLIGPGMTAAPTFEGTIIIEE
jgi:hypothetical protein